MPDSLSRPFRTAPMKDGVRYDDRGEPIRPEQREEPLRVALNAWLNGTGDHVEDEERLVIAAREWIDALDAGPRSEPHTLLWPPHPGDGYQSSALCSCGDFQWDADTQGDLFNATRAVLRDWTAHVAGPRSEEGLREAADRVIAWADHHEPWNPSGDFDALRKARRETSRE